MVADINVAPFFCRKGDKLFTAYFYTKRPSGWILASGFSSFASTSFPVRLSKPSNDSKFLELLPAARWVNLQNEPH
jgi:hypothetical protein